ncbi:UDP-3-O-(3-hydroxymyristoyl)glucosamine N-acyltransferase [Parasediminibacterium sp. JCM 36343]|uniref:UDP-3-O-(3-hydroxymyristoyl)glucosamine N-acyltransferase n=1 Tax=Parasediminibacterium sp. JCM 36343 TaxID=3374279 RepID=UPI00397D9432
MRFTAAQIAMMINGKIEGDENASVASFGKIEDATEGQLAFLSNLKYEEFLYTTKASIVIVNNSLVLKEPTSATLLRVADAYSAFATLMLKYEEIVSQQLVGIQQPSYIAESSTVGSNVFVAAFAYIGENVTIGNGVKLFSGVVIGNNVTISNNTILHPGVKIYHDCIIGSNVIIHAGSVIGSDGFGFAPLPDGSYKKIPQIGNVIIEDDVEIGANCTIDRATMGSTIISKGVKLDNLVQIAHNVEIGNNTVMAAQVGVSGSTKVGKNVVIGGQAGLTGHINIADGTKINAKSGVSKSIKTQNTSVTGMPADNFMFMKRLEALYKNLPELEKRVRELEKRLGEGN